MLGQDAGDRPEPLEVQIADRGEMIGACGLGFGPFRRLGHDPGPGAGQPQCGRGLG